LSDKADLRVLITVAAIAALICVAADRLPPRRTISAVRPMGTARELKAAGVLIQAGTTGAQLSAGGSTITIDKQGNITINAARNLSLKAGGDLNLTAQNNVQLVAKKELQAEGKLKAGIKSGTSLAVEGQTNVTVDGGMLCTVKAGVIQLN
jgi:hypothetical protein